MIRAAGGACVFVRTGDAPGGGFFQRRPVEVQTVSADRVRVISGVHDGDVIVVKGSLGLAQEMEQP